MGYNYPEYPYHEDADDYDHWENDCGLFEDESDGLLWCGSAGSEDCDFRCPFSHLIGEPADDGGDAESEG